MERNEGIYYQMRDKFNYQIKRDSGITRRHIKLAIMYIYELTNIYGTLDNENIGEEEELDVALEYWKFLYKYNLIVNLNKRVL